MFNMRSDFIFVILHFLIENNFHEAAQKLEQESKVYFNIMRFTSMVLRGMWSDVDEYLRSFTSPSDNAISMMMFWFIEKQKFLEALDEGNAVQAVAIFGKDIKPCWQTDTNIKHQELSELLNMKKFRENELYANFDIPKWRLELVSTLKCQLKNNLVFRGKLDFPTIKSRRLEELMAQSGLWQQLLWKQYLRSDDIVKVPAHNTLYADHKYKLSSSSISNQHLMEGAPVTNALGNEAGGSSSPWAAMDLTRLEGVPVTNARGNEVGGSSSPWAAMDLTRLEGVPVTNAGGNEAGGSSSPWAAMGLTRGVPVTNARGNEAGGSSSPWAAMDLTRLEGVSVTYSRGNEAGSSSSPWAAMDLNRLEGVPVTNLRGNEAGPSSSPWAAMNLTRLEGAPVTNARNNGAGPYAYPLTAMDVARFFQK